MRTAWSPDWVVFKPPTRDPTMRASRLLRIILGIQGIIVRGYSFDEEGLVADIAPLKTIARCGECGRKSHSVHDRRQRYWRHLDAAGMEIKLKYTMRRIHCRNCRGVKTESIDWAPENSGFTHGFEERAAYLAQQTSRTAVAEMMRITWRTVGSIVRRVVARHLDEVGDRLAGLRHIGIDELSYRKHHEYITVVIDHERNVVVWSKRGKSAATLRDFFEELGPQRCAMLESVTIDMSPAFISTVTEMVPNALMVFDRFHVQRLVQHALDETRRDVVRQAGTAREKAGLKGTRWSLLKSPWNLTDADRQTLAELERSNATLFRGHMLKESFVAILDGRQVNVARGRIEQWMRDAEQSGLPHFQRVAVTVRKHLGGILEYVRTRFSNGRTEGLNGKIRTITRRSFGFHSAHALIAMIFLCCGGVRVTPAFSTPFSSH